MCGSIKCDSDYLFLGFFLYKILCEHYKSFRQIRGANKYGKYGLCPKQENNRRIFKVQIKDFSKF